LLKERLWKGRGLFSINADFEEKCDEAELLIQHIDDLSKERGNVNRVSILKSAFILLLYNMLESTSVLVLERVHEKVSSHQYNELSDKLKKIFIEFYLLNENSKKQQGKLDLIISNNLTFPLFSDYNKKVNLFSGNLDARQLSSVTDRYGIGKITSNNKDMLLTIKNKRNKIAHGEEMFKESCRNLTIRELNLIKVATFDALKQMLNMTKLYFEQKRYIHR